MIRKLTADTAGGLTYDQVGFDIMSHDHQNIDGKHHKIFIAGSGTDSSNKQFNDFPSNGKPHWIGIHNCGTVQVEVCSVQARSMTGDDYSKNGTYNPLSTVLYADLLPGDIIYGKFIEVAILQTSAHPYIDTLRLIRGV